jgi:hypothetical protein
VGDAILAAMREEDTRKQDRSPGPAEPPPSSIEDAPPTFGDLPTMRFEAPPPLDVAADASAFETASAFLEMPSDHAPTEVRAAADGSDVFTGLRDFPDDEPTSVDRGGARVVARNLAHLGRLREALHAAARALDAQRTEDGTAGARAVRETIATIDVLVDVQEG